MTLIIKIILVSQTKSTHSSWSWTLARLPTTTLLNTQQQSFQVYICYIPHNSEKEESSDATKYHVLNNINNFSWVSDSPFFLILNADVALLLEKLPNTAL